MYGVVAEEEYRNEAPESTLAVASSHHSSSAWSIVESQRALKHSARDYIMLSRLATEMKKISITYKYLC